jgi:predicted regulator of Ras-like GTPase activity (Roadblock/LC7/MglB family)
MFVEALKEVVENTDGAVASLLMDVEGIPLESYIKEGMEAPFDIEVVGAEFSVIVKSVQRTVDSLEAGGTREVAVQAERVITLIRVLTDEYFVALALDPSGNIGKGRYMLRINAPKLLAELA